MRMMNEAEAREWCAFREIVTENVRRPVFAASPTPTDYTISLPTSGLQLVHLGLQLSADFSEGEHWRCMIWLLESGMWAQAAEAVGARLWDRLLQANLGSRHSGQGSICLFDGDERYDKAILLTTIMLFQWDAVAIPEHGEYMIQFSHDGFIKMLFRQEPGDRAPLDEFLAAWKNDSSRAREVAPGAQGGPRGRNG